MASAAYLLSASVRPDSTDAVIGRAKISDRSPPRLFLYALVPHFVNKRIGECVFYLYMEVRDEGSGAS